MCKGAFERKREGEEKNVKGSRENEERRHPFERKGVG